MTLWTVFSWMLVTVMQVVVGRRFYRNAYKVHGNPSIPQVFFACCLACVS